MSDLKEQLLDTLNSYSKGPISGIFTDGGATPNPGTGGWGAVYVKDNEIIKQAHGNSPDTTNNRMELTAIKESFKLLENKEEVTIYSDSNLCVQTFNTWAKAWEKKGWKRKSGPIKNLELVQEVYQLFKEYPYVSIEWVPAHSGWRWNEYVDVLASNRDLG